MEIADKEETTKSREEKKRTVAGSVEDKVEFEAECLKRTDMRKKRVLTIDPFTAKDLDDAISLERIPGTRIVEVGVHIADVGHGERSRSHT